MLKQQTEDLRKAMLEAFDVYTNHFKEFKAFEGKMIDETNYDQINKAISDIQDSFSNLYPTFNFITTFSQFAKNSMASYQGFIDSLKEMGAKEVTDKDGAN